MFNKKFLFVLILSMVAVVAVSAVSAADANRTDDIAIVNDDIKATNEITEISESAVWPADNLAVAGEGNSSGESANDNVLGNGNCAQQDSILFNDGFNDIKAIGTAQNHEDNNGDAQSRLTPLDIKASNWVTTYKSGKTLNIRLVCFDGAVKGVPIEFKIYNGEKVVKSFTLKSGADGYIRCKLSGLAPGKYSVQIRHLYGEDSYDIAHKKVSVTVNKQPLSIITKSLYSKKSGSVYVKVINKATKKALDGIKLVLKVYTGSRYKSYSLVTGYDKILKSHGMAAIETNQLPAGNHKVVITASNKYYRGSAVANLKILLTVKFFAKFTGFLTNGKRY